MLNTDHRPIDRKPPIQPRPSIELRAVREPFGKIDLLQIELIVTTAVRAAIERDGFLSRPFIRDGGDRVLTVGELLAPGGTCVTRRGGETFDSLTMLLELELARVATDLARVSSTLASRAAA